MARKKPENQINLLPQEEFEASTFGRTLKWLLGTFRYMVIVTEMVVMMAFLSRFWLDARTGQLIDSINQKKVVISSYSSFEKQFRDAQKEISIFKDYSAANQALSPILSAIASKVSGEMVLTEILVAENKVTISGEANDEVTATNFINSLRSVAELHDVSLTSVAAKKDSVTLSFVVDAKLTGRGIGNGR